MLVLTRKPSQSVTIDNQITVKIVRIRGNTVQLGIEAPRDVQIMRSELLEAQPLPRGDAPQSNDLAAGRTSREDESADCPLPSEPGDHGRGQPLLATATTFSSPLQQFIFAP